MGEVRQETVVPLEPEDAMALWTDVDRWPTFVEGFARVLEMPEDWPQAGAKLVWESIPEGRGRVTEKVTENIAAAAFATRVFEERLTGIQRITFEPDPDGAYVELGLEYSLTREGAFGVVMDVLFIRRALNDALYRTLRRFRIEAAEEETQR